MDRRGRERGTRKGNPFNERASEPDTRNTSATRCKLRTLRKYCYGRETACASNNKSADTAVPRHLNGGWSRGGRNSIQHSILDPSPLQRKRWNRGPRKRCARVDDRRYHVMDSRVSFRTRRKRMEFSLRMAWPGEKRGNLETRRLLPTGLAYFGNCAA